MPMKQKVARKLADLSEEITLRLRIYSIVRKGLIGFILISLLNVLFSQVFQTPKMYGIARDNHEAVIKYQLMRDKIRVAERRLAEIRHRDNSVYRTLFSSDTLALAPQPYPDSKYESLQQDEYAALMTETWRELDALAQDLYYESVSFDELQTLAKNKERLSSAIPAIWPVDRLQLRALYSFGWRFHPIYKSRKFHKGVDMACDRGVPVYASGDAVVESTDIGQRRKGYGQQILLNHEFGYKTRYAHLSKILVSPGDKVTRGQLIGEVGSTGGSTGPHLHYEVIYMGQEVNPVNYFDKNMTVDEYRRLIEEMKDSDLEVQ
ncbi:MAG: M23 family metallopeptidase [Alistipes sp.]|nr:M23 family metallopeptidase [Alistipes sp.]